MPWTPKPTAPASFNLKDAFSAAIAGDAVWGWLLDWVFDVPDLVYDTAAFCASGPYIAGALVITDFIPTFNPADPSKILSTLALGTKIAAASRDRVFGTYCENVDVLSGGWGPSEFFDSPSHVSGGTTIAPGPGGHTTATSVRVRMTANNWDGVDPTHLNPHVIVWDAGSGFVDVYHPSGGDPVPSAWHSTPWVNGSHVDFYVYAHDTGTFEFQWNAADTPDTHTPTAQPNPGVPAAPTTTADLADIAHELDMQEAKLDFLTQLVQSLLLTSPTIPAFGVDDPVDAIPDTPTPVLTAIGVVLTISGVPAGADVGFGLPQQLSKIGRINFGTATAWFPSIPLTHSPMVIRPLPPGCTQVVVSGLPPGVSATVAMIQPAK